MTPKRRGLVDPSTKGKKATHPYFPSASLDPAQQNIHMGTPSTDLKMEETPQGKSILNPWLLELMNQLKGSHEAGMTTMLDFSKQHASFNVDSDNKIIKVRYARPRDYKSKMKVAPSNIIVQENKLNINQLISQEVMSFHKVSFEA